MLTEAQLRERATYIGSSDAKVIASGDIAKWTALARQKSGEEEWKPTKQVQLMMDAGTHLEPFIIDQWAAQQKRQVNFRGGGKTILINDIPLHSTFDGRLVGDNAPLEIKAHFGFKDMDELADFYAPQCQHHMLVAGADRCYFVALFGVHCRLEWRMLTKDESWCAQYLEQAAGFWNFYKNGVSDEAGYVMPPVDHSDMFVGNLRDIVPDFNSELDHELGFAAQSIIDAKQVIKVSDEAKDRFKELMPQDCRRMDYDLGGNLKGHWIRVTRTRSGTVSCSHLAPKEDKDA
jgi:predicted phage-related endonuclease